MFRHYVYIHRRLDNGEVFYVGKGTIKPRCRSQVFDRAESKSRRNSWWLAIVEKHGYTVEVIASCMDDAAAQELEISLIASYGRANLGAGSLVNLTDGGDGHAGLIATEQQRLARSRNASKPRSQSWVHSIRLARKEGGNGGVVKKGDKLPNDWCEKIAAAKRGAKNPMFGKTGEAHPRRKAVIDAKTGAVYPTTTAAAKAAGMRMQTLHNMLTGFRPNSTSMRFA